MSIISVRGNYTLVLTPETFIMNTSNIYLECYTDGANPPIVITLPRITDVNGQTNTWGFKIFINDAGNNASVKNITLVPHPADKINGTLSAPVVLNTNGVTGHLQITGGNSWEFSLGSSSSGGGVTTPNKVYQALLTQLGTTVNSVTDNIQNASDSNYLGLPNVAWTRLSQGQYNGYKLGAFPDGKVQIYMGNNTPNSYSVSYDKVSGDADNIIIKTSRISQGVNRIARLNSNGLYDIDYSQILGFNQKVVAMAKQSDNKLIVVGQFTTYDGTIANKIARLNTDGSLDTTFNVGGTGAICNFLTSVAIQVGGVNDGKIYIGGLFFSSYNGNTVGNIARLNSNGTFDASFNVGGTGFTGSLPLVADIKIQVGGVNAEKIYVGGGFSDYTDSFGLHTANGIARLNTGGTYDTTFNSLGTGFIGGGFVNAIAIQSSDDKILTTGGFAGYNDGVVHNQQQLARLNTDGTYDTTFNSLGTGFNGGGNYAVVVQSSGVNAGKIYVLGSFSTFNDGSSHASNFIIRLNSNGTFDSTFVTGVGLSSIGQFAHISIQSDEKVIISSNFTAYNNVNSPMIVRINPNGVIDSTFLISASSFNNAINSTIIQVGGIDNGKIYVGGDFNKTLVDTLSDNILNETPIQIIVKP